MAENVGTIEYTVKADTAQLLTGGQEVTKVTGQMEKAFEGVDKSAQTMNTSLTRTAQAVNSASKSGTNMRGVFGQLGYQIQDVSVQLQMGQNAMLVFAQQGSQIASIFGPSGAVVGAIIAVAGALLGSLIPSLMNSESQIDKTKDAIESLGKVIKISESGVAALSNEYASLAKNNAELARQMQTVAIQKYNLAVQDASKAITDIVDDQSSWWRSLNNGAANVKLMGDSLRALDITTDDFSEAMKQAAGAGVAFQYQTNTIINTVAMLSSQFGISDQQAYQLSKSLNSLSKNPTPEMLTQTVSLLQSFKSNTSDGTKAVNELSEQLITAGASMAEAKRIADQLASSIGNLSTAAQQTNFEQMQQQLKTEIIALRDGKLAAEKYALANADIAEDKKPVIAALLEEKHNLEQQAKAQKASGQAAKKTSAAESEVNRQIQQMQQVASGAQMSMDGLNREQYINQAVSKIAAKATEQQKVAMAEAAGAAFDATQKQKDLNAAISADPTRKENKAYQDATAQLDRQLQGNLLSQEQYNSQSEQLAVQHQQALAKIASQQAVSPQQQAAGDVDPVQQLANENAQKIALIQQYEQARVISSQQADALIAASQTQYEQQRLAAIEQQYRAQSQLNDFMMSTIDAVGQRTTNAITGLITGTQSASDAVRNLASTILDQAVGALVQMGVQAIKNMVIGQTAASASTALAATTGAAMAAAYAPAAALASLASFGANSAPAMAGITSTVGLAQGLALAGARRYGGTTSAGSMYRVNESGEPEMFQSSSGKQYMMPTTSGKVIPAGEVAGGGTGAPVLNIYNYSSASVDAQATQNSDGSWTLEAFVADMNNGGPASQAITANHNVKRTPRGQN